MAFYEDLIVGYERDYQFLKNEFNIFPKIANFGTSDHSNSILAIFLHLGIEGIFIEGKQ